MGNKCCLVAVPVTSASRDFPIRRKGSAANVSTVSSVQSTWSSKDEPILPINKYFLTTSSPFSQTEIDGLVRVFIDRRNNAVILTDADSGLTVASAHAVTGTAYAISSPEGRVLTHMCVSRKNPDETHLSFDHYSRYVACAERNSLTISHNNRIVCQIHHGDCLAAPILRGSLPGIDLTAVLLFIAVNQLIQ